MREAQLNCETKQTMAYLCDLEHTLAPFAAKDPSHWPINARRIKLTTQEQAHKNGMPIVSFANSRMNWSSDRTRVQLDCSIAESLQAPSFQCQISNYSRSSSERSFPFLSPIQTYVFSFFVSFRNFCTRFRTSFSHPQTCLSVKSVCGFIAQFFAPTGRKVVWGGGSRTPPTSPPTTTTTRAQYEQI